MTVKILITQSENILFSTYQLKRTMRGADKYCKGNAKHRKYPNIKFKKFKHIQHYQSLKLSLVFLQNLYQMKIFKKLFPGLESQRLCLK